MERIILTNKIFSLDNLLSDYKIETIKDPSLKEPLKIGLKYLFSEIIEFELAYHYVECPYSSKKQRMFFINMLDAIIFKQRMSILEHFLVKYKYIKLEDNNKLKPGDIIKIKYDSIIKSQYYIVTPYRYLIRYDNEGGTRGTSLWLSDSFTNKQELIDVFNKYFTDAKIISVEKMDL